MMKILRDYYMYIIILYIIQIKEYYSDWTCKSCDNKIYMNSPVIETPSLEIVIPRSKSIEKFEEVFEEEFNNQKQIINSIPTKSSSLLVPFPSTSPISSPIHINTPKLSPISKAKKTPIPSPLLQPPKLHNNIKYIDHPVYMKYFKMLKTGIPPPAVQHCIYKDGYNFDINIITEHNPNDIVEEENEIEIVKVYDDENKSKNNLLSHLHKIDYSNNNRNDNNNSEIIKKPSIELNFAVSPNNDDNNNDDNEKIINEYVKQYKNGKILNEILIDLYNMKYEKSIIDSVLKKLNINTQEIQFKRNQHPILKQYYKMTMVGVPIEAVNHKMIKDNINPKLLEGNENDMIDYDLSKYNNNDNNNKEKEICLKDHPMYIYIYI